MDPAAPGPSARTLDEADLHPDPVEQFRRWFDEALRSSSPQPTAMTLATADADGRPSARVVLLKGFDERGFVFYTNYESRKGRELDANPWAALVFFWPELERQVRIEGRVQRVAPVESDVYFRSRPRDSQLGARASRQSRVIDGRDVLDRRFEELRVRFEGGEVPRPEYWGGYRVIPESLEFWQGRPNRLHDRLRYDRVAGPAWSIRRLSP